MKKFTKRVIKEKSGFRFRRIFVYMRRRYGAHWAMKVLLLFIGTVFFLAGVVMLVTPGPGWLFILLGCVVLAATSYRFARRMDKLERAVVRKYQRFRNRKK